MTVARPAFISVGRRLIFIVGFRESRVKKSVLAGRKWHYRAVANDPLNLLHSARKTRFSTTICRLCERVNSISIFPPTALQRRHAGHGTLRG